MKINLGCGWDKKKGFINIDCSKEVKPDKVHDLNEGLDFLKDNSVDYIYSSHTLEHIKPCCFHNLLKEMYRVSKKGGIWEIIVPFDNMIERAHIDHFRTFNFSGFDQYCRSGNRFYFQDQLWLERISKREPALVRYFFYLLPMLKREIRFVYKVIK